MRYSSMSELPAQKSYDDMSKEERNAFDKDARQKEETEQAGQFAAQRLVAGSTLLPLWPRTVKERR